MRLSTMLAAAALALLAAAPAASAAPAPRPVKPADGHTFAPPVRGVTFVVEAEANEPDGSLHVEFTDADGSVGANGRYEHESGVDDYVLKPVEPGSNRYSVEVSRDVFRRYGGGEFYWHAYRVLPNGSCPPIPGSGGAKDCFQESAQRTFSNSTPAGWDAYEPNNSAAKATGQSDYFNQDCAYLETRSDKDWFRFKAPRTFRLRLRLENFAGTNEWDSLGPPRRESGNLRVSLYRAKGRKAGRRLASKRVPVGKQRVLRAKVRAKRRYLFTVRHAGNGHRRARPDKSIFYTFGINLPRDFADASGCA